jgi:hypothetical protein
MGFQGLTTYRSIREFCDLTMPILMFDQNQDYVVLKLEDVSRLPS